MSMFDIIPLLLILISLVVIIIIVVRKFSMLANLDVDSIPAEREAKFKEKLVSQRFKRSILKWNFKATKLLKPVLSGSGQLTKLLHDKLLELKDKHAPKREASEVIVVNKIDDLFSEIENKIKEENFSEAEKKIIEIIGHDSKNFKAFKLLAKIYFEQKNYSEAKQTYQHILKLVEDRLGQHNTFSEQFDGFRDAENDINQASTYHDLSLTCIELKDYKDAVKSIKNALLIEPSNPRYLDTLLEISIMNKDKELAENTYRKLSESNPENNKLAEFSKRIEEIKTN